MLFLVAVLVTLQTQPGLQLHTSNCSISNEEPEVRTVVKHMLNNYDTRIRPNYTGQPVNVYVDFSILSFGHIEEVNMVFPVDMFLRQRWHDPRLKHSLKKPITLLMGKRHPADSIWVPDTVLINSINSEMHHVTVNNDKLDIYPNGHVFWGTRITSVGSCRLDLRSYPMDTQTCLIGLESYAYPVDHMIYNWHSQPGIKIIDQEMSQYELVEFKTYKTFVSYVAGNYSILNAAFTFKRRTGNSILRIYTPTIAIVCVSWISLWIDQDSIAARVSLCITTLLTLSTIWGAVNSTLPRVSYVKAVDTFFMVSFFFVFYTLVQYTLVLNLSSRSRMKAALQREEKEEDGALQTTSYQIDAEPLVAESEGCEAGHSTCKYMEQEEKQFIHCPGSKAHQNLRQRFKTLKETEAKRVFIKKEQPFKTSKIDLVGRVALPVGYLMFNIYYWTKYLGRGNVADFVQ